jgi:hypothetical protein
MKRLCNNLPSARRVAILAVVAVVSVPLALASVAGAAIRGRQGDCQW